MSEKTNKPKWLSQSVPAAAPVAAPAPAPAAADDQPRQAGGSGVAYTLKSGSGISVARGVTSKESHSILLPVPLLLKERLEALMEGGAISGAIVGLIAFALDELERQERRIIIQKEA